MSRSPLVAATFAASALIAAPAFADPVRIVAAENFYGDVAGQIGGDAVTVVSILSSPDQDPHLFEASAETAKALAEAKIVIVNGVDYDPWMEKLLGAHKAPGRKEIVVAKLVGRKAGDNPHLWYDPDAVKAAAKALTADLDAIDPDHRADYDKGEAQFLDSLKPLDAKIADMRKKYAGAPVIASEPVFGYQAGLIGLNVHNEKFALAVMNNAEPGASEVAAFESDLKGHKVKAMLYNAQASEPAVGRLVQMAKDNSNVTIRLGGRDILSTASFIVEDREFIGMLGANGAGKTTLMRATLGLTPVASGAISVLDQPVTRGHSSIGYMPQNRGLALGLRLTGYDVVASAAIGARFGFARLDKAMRREIDWALDHVDARDLARRSLGELSGGERQRLLLSQALLGRPRLLLLDEPLISLDPAHQKGVVDIARRLRDELRVAIVFSAHELNPLVNAIDRVLYLGAGAAVIGPVDEVVTGPVLSRLYGAEIEVVRIKDRFFVMAGDVDVERDAHRHERGDHGHSHGE
ncbi:MAG: zinc ABC transporter substrate-binding protein [Roseiarcus sp.]|uniref:metal ABC transporter solute-binding protein, Zn/Mn family n=1 Tax=Roseiarcus sp. TaxID=1969460 RepID=UPI003C15C7C9